MAKSKDKQRTSKKRKLEEPEEAEPVREESVNEEPVNEEPVVSQTIEVHMQDDSEEESSASEASFPEDASDVSEESEASEFEEEIVPQKLKPPANEPRRDRFREYYMDLLTSEFGDELDMLRKDKNFSERSLGVLIRSLEEGRNIFSEEERRLILEQL